MGHKMSWFLTQIVTSLGMETQSNESSNDAVLKQFIQQILENLKVIDSLCLSIDEKIRRNISSEPNPTQARSLKYIDTVINYVLSTMERLKYEENMLVQGIGDFESRLKLLKRQLNNSQNLRALILQMAESHGLPYTPPSDEDPMTAP